MSHPTFVSRHHAINYYKKIQRDVDGDLQDWLVHYEKIKAEKVSAAMLRLRELQDLIDWNRAELKREASKAQGTLTSFSREDEGFSSSLGFNDNEVNF